MKLVYRTIAKAHGECNQFQLTQLHMLGQWIVQAVVVNTFIRQQRRCYRDVFMGKGYVGRENREVPPTPPDRGKGVACFMFI